RPAAWRAAAAHAATTALCPAEQRCPGRAAPPSPSRPPATTAAAAAARATAAAAARATAAAAARATATAGRGAAGSTGGAAGAGGSGPTTDRGGELSSDLLAEGICQTFTLPASSQQNGIAEHRIGLIMEVARTSMIYAAAPHFLWLFAVRYAAHQLNLWPRVSEPETSPTPRWTGKVGDALVFRVWGALSIVRDAKASKLSSRTLRCVFLGFPRHPAVEVLPPTRASSLLLPGLDPLPPQGLAPSGVSQVDPPPLGAEAEGEGSGGAATGGAGSWGAATGGADSGGAASLSGCGAVGDPARGPGAGQPPQP
ncbi:unnamed protein product, partial [Closterium sp. NIES-53]